MPHSSISIGRDSICYAAYIINKVKPLGMANEGQIEMLVLIEEDIPAIQCSV